MKLPNIYIIDQWVHLRIGRCTYLRVCTEDEVAHANEGQFASMVQSAMAMSEYHAIDDGRRYVLH